MMNAQIVKARRFVRPACSCCLGIMWRRAGFSLLSSQIYLYTYPVSLLSLPDAANSVILLRAELPCDLRHGVSPSQGLKMERCRSEQLPWRESHAISAERIW